MDREIKPKIIAKTIEEFQEIEKKLKELPELVYSQIEIVDGNGLVGLTCHFKKTWSSDTRICLPKKTSQIKDFGDYIGIYCDEFFFKIPKDNKIDFVFID